MLHDAGYLHYSDSDHIYTLSLKLFRISHRFAPVHNLTKLAMPIMQRVCHQLLCGATTMKHAGAREAKNREETQELKRHTLQQGIEAAYRQLEDGQEMPFDEAAVERIKAAGRSKLADRSSAQ